MGLITNGKDGALDSNGINTLTEFAITGDYAALDVLIDQIGEEMLQELAKPGAPISATVNEIRQEYIAVLQARMTLLQATAIRTLESVMSGTIGEGASPAVSAANSVLNRGDFPPRSRAESVNLKVVAEARLPSLGEIMADGGDGEIDEWLSALGNVQRLVEKKVKDNATD